MVDWPSTGFRLVQKAGIALSIGAVGGVCLLGARCLIRVQFARSRLQALIAATAGEEARIVITGATSGIGEELARQFLRHPSTHVLLGCRDVQKAERLFRSSPRTKIVPLELLDFDSVQAFSDECFDFLNGGEDGLRLLFNNAGVMKPPHAKQGKLDPTWQSNFVAPFLLTELLAQRRNTAGTKKPLRVVNVGSRLERRSTLDEQMLQDANRGQAGPSSYSDAKRAMMLWTSVRAQSMCFSGTMYVHAATPGMVDTQLGRNSVKPWLWPLTKPLRIALLRPAAVGALGVAAAALSPQATQSYGRYFDGTQELEDLVMERMGEKQFALKVVKWASVTSALEARLAGYDK